MRPVALLALMTLAPSALMAQDSYVPTQKLPNGREIVLVYIGAVSCGPCSYPEVKAAVRKSKVLVSQLAKKKGAAFSAIGVANDWDLKAASAFFDDSLGAFDQLVLGGNWTNLAAERFIWAYPKDEPAMPQIAVFERRVTAGKFAIEFSQMRLLRRLVGHGPITAWVNAGAPIEIRAKS